MEKTPVFTRADIGCFFDNHRGSYMGEAVINLAIHHGWKPEPEPGIEHDFTADGLFYHELWTEAEDYLQSLCADDVMFDTEQGDFTLIEIDAEGERVWED